MKLFFFPPFNTGGEGNHHPRFEYKSRGREVRVVPSALTLILSPGSELEQQPPPPCSLPTAANTYLSITALAPDVAPPWPRQVPQSMKHMLPLALGPEPCSSGYGTSSGQGYDGKVNGSDRGRGRWQRAKDGKQYWGQAAGKAK